MNNSHSASYAAAGVDIEAGYKGVQLMKKHVARTMVPGVVSGIGGFDLAAEWAGWFNAFNCEIDSFCRKVLKYHFPQARQYDDIRTTDFTVWQGRIDVLTGGFPCQPFSIAGKQLGKDDERDLFPHILRLAYEINPKAVMIENVRGLMDSKFIEYRSHILNSLEQLGYRTYIKLINSSDYGVPQLRPRVVIIGIRNDISDTFEYPAPIEMRNNTVGTSLLSLMSENGWKGASEWAAKANRIAPTLVGGSKKHGGPDLGPTRARKAWAELGIDGRGIANEAPTPDYEGMPRLTPKMLAKLQGFPDDWVFGSKKTAACRMIGNAFPPPVAKAIGQQIVKVLTGIKP